MAEAAKEGKKGPWTLAGQTGRLGPSADYARWLGEELDPRDLMQPFPAETMRIWPVSTRVNKPENDGPSVIEPVELIVSAA